MLEEIKAILRVTDTEYNAEIQGLIESCKADLELAGINPAIIDLDPPDALIMRAIVVYCQMSFGMENKDADRFARAYDSLKVRLCLSQRYTSDEVA